jgi:membrane protease YdiL (CAAX protease family)
MIVNVGLIILFAIALRLEKKDLNVFGIQPFLKRLVQLLLGFALAAILSIIVNIMFGQFANFSWEFNVYHSIEQLLTGTYNTLNSVLFEELIFRTYLLYKLIQFVGEKKSIIITSAGFGVYHWFTFGLLGNYPMMIWVFFYTGLWGAMFAFCYTRTGTILLSIGLHWGWNFFDQVIFDRNGTGLVRPVTTDRTVFLNGTYSFLITTLPTILFAVIIIGYLTSVKRLQIKT